MNEEAAAATPPEETPRRLGITEAMGMGWRLMASDFWPLFLAALVVVAILLAMKMVPCLSYLEPVATIFVQPPLMAGLFLVVQRRIDGARVETGNVFLGFKERYLPSVVAGLPVTLTALVVGLLAFAGQLALQFLQFGSMRAFGFGQMGPGGMTQPDEFFRMYATMMAGAYGIWAVKAAIVGAVNVFLMFALLLVWEYREHGWEAAKASARLVCDHFWEALGFSVLFGLLWLAASLAGMIACCVGLFFTLSVFQVWHAASIVYLYRSWTGQALVQPLEAAPAEEGPIPPTDIQPPPA